MGGAGCQLQTPISRVSSSVESWKKLCFLGLFEKEDYENKLKIEKNALNNEGMTFWL